MTADIFFEVDDAAFTNELRDTENDLDRLINDIAHDLARELGVAGGQHASELGNDWGVDGVGSYERHISSPVWWAHFISGGTQSHGPRTASKLVFTIDGETIFADEVRGIPATHFDEQAIAKTRSHVDDIVRRLIR